MAQMPIEIVEIGGLATFEVSRALSLANSLQREFLYLKLKDNDARDLQIHAFQEMKTNEFLNSMEKFRTRISGFHPYLIAFVDAYLEGEDYANIFGTDRPQDGLAVFTVWGVPGDVIPADRMHAYFVYYLAKATLCFLAPEKKDHDDTRRCVFDRKIKKRDIVKSMRARALCDECRNELLNRPGAISSFQLEAIDRLFQASGNILEGETGQQSLPRAFIGSSSEGLAVARQLQEMLGGDLTTIIWNQGTVFGLTNTTIESLEEAVLDYDCGIFILTKDDRLVSRGRHRDVARDNVVFELGLFMGKLTRRRVLVVQAHGVSLPSDLSGLTTASYSPIQKNLTKALNSAVRQIRSVLGTTSSENVKQVPLPKRL
jgi:predicted nucleotide-binding protein